MKNTKVKITAKCPPGMGRLKGQDVQVTVDGKPITNITRLSWRADARNKYVECSLVLHDVEVDLEGELALDVNLRSSKPLVPSPSGNIGATADE